MKFSLKSLAAVVLLSSPLAHAGRFLSREDPIGGSYIVVVKEDVQDGGDVNLHQVKEDARKYGGIIHHEYTRTVRGVAVQCSAEVARRLAESDLVSYVEEDGPMFLSQAADWGIDRIDQRELPLDGQFNPRNSGLGVTSYIIDTGIRISHQEFQGRAEWGTNIIDDNDTDCNGHGTHVAGTVAGAMYGVGKATKVVAVKVFPCSGGTSTSNVIAAMDWVAADAATNPDTPSTCNMSLGGGYSQASNDAAAALVDSGVVTVVAAGNDNGDACSKSPASEPKVITVGSTTSSDARSSFSNYGTCVDIFAPGSSITSAWYTSDTAFNSISGTSMASPHVCGVAGLALAAGVDAFDVPDELTNGATEDVVTDPGPNSPNLFLFAGNIVPTISPAPSIHFPSAEPSNSNAPSNAPTECNNDILEVTLLTDQWGSETSWVLEDTCFGQNVGSGNSYASSTLYEDYFCALAPESAYKFTIFDSWGDGICCGYGEGFYEVSLNGDIVATGGNFGSSEETVFGADECPPCQGDVVTVSIFTDSWSFETGYTLEDDCIEEVVFSREQGYFGQDDTLYVDEFCTPNAGAAYTFTITDSYGDGICCLWGQGFYEVVLDGEVVASGGEFGSSEATSFGSCDSPTPCVDSDLLVPFGGNLLDCSTIVGSGGCSNPLAASHCPLGCDACDEYACEDSEAPWSVFGNTYNCGMLASQDPEVIETYCNDFNLGPTCRGTCGFC